MTKTEYKAVKCAWARAVNNKDYKPYKDEYGTKYDGKLNALHFMIYNIIRGFPTNRGFEPEGQGFINTQKQLDFSIKFDTVERQLFPFENLVTLEAFKELVK